jgi:hypothetical protein
MADRLFAYSVRHGADFVTAGHVMGENAADARSRVVAEYQRMHSAEYLAGLRRADPVHGAALADLSEMHPPIAAYTVVVRVSKAKNPADWVVESA